MNNALEKHFGLQLVSLGALIRKILYYLTIKIAKKITQGKSARKFNDFSGKMSPILLRKNRSSIPV